MAELVDARDLKSCVPADDTQLSCKTPADRPIENDGNPARLQNSAQPWMAGMAGLPRGNKIKGCDTNSSPKDASESLVNHRRCRTFDAQVEIDRRLSDALHDAG